MTLATILARLIIVGCGAWAIFITITLPAIGIGR